MICLNNSRPDQPHGEALALLPHPEQLSPRVYDGRFGLAFASNLCTATIVAMLYRYADLVHYLGGSEFQLGWIVGAGAVGSLVMRFVLGRAIDRHGTRAVWLVSLVTLTLSCFGHLLLSSCSGPVIYALRILMISSTAGVFGSSITWVSNRTPRARLAEMIGMLGASGFIAMALGNYLGDVLADSAAGTVYIQRLFLTAGLLAALATAFAWLATRGTVVMSVESPHDSMVRLLWRYSPRVVLLVGVATGIALGLPGTFVRPFTLELGISNMITFFGVYAGVALAIRVCARRFPERLGLARVILLGLVLLTVGLASFLLVQTEWQLVIPATILGIAHGLVFPPTIAASTLSFPENCRGLGTMLILGAYDLGVLIGAPLAGAIIHFSGLLGLSPYPTMFALIGGLLGLISVIYAVSLLRRAPAASQSTSASASEVLHAEILDGPPLPSPVAARCE